ncbi:sensor histidine kinase [Pseudonocardia sp. CA-107938]|uniref:sensor histidine kinase n=1 Tax=Pseudonocardia sp. CA-107938 TaxID=3240021 RepID=UPI003D8AA187
MLRLRWWPPARYLVVGAGTGIASIVAVVLLFAGALLGLAPAGIGLVQRLAAVERTRAGRLLGAAVPQLPAAPDGGPVAVLASPAFRRDLRAVAVHAAVGTLAGSVAVGAPLGLLQNVAVALAWPLLPGATTSLDVPVDSPSAAVLAVLTGLGYAAIGIVVVPPLGRWYARSSARRLAPPEPTLVERLAEVTATRAAALEAHGTELRRIERDLHDGTQNRLVAVVMHLGILERALERDPAGALPLVQTAQDAATGALAELREVVRHIYPPVLADRGLAGAVAALVTRCPVPARLEDASLDRAPAAVEAAAYFAVAEALSNVAKHSGAEHVLVRMWTADATLHVEVRDDGRGGAEAAERQGSGLTGIRRRVAAFDGTTELISPPGGPTVLRIALPTRG